MRKPLLLCVATLLLASSAALAQHFDGNAGNGTFNPQIAITVPGTYVDELTDLTFDATQADHEDPVVFADFKTPGDWQFGFSTIRQGEDSTGVPTTSCKKTIDGLNNSPDGTGVGTNMDFSKRGDAKFVRAEKIGTAHAEIHADGISRPNGPVKYDGDTAFISFDAVTNTATLCILFITTDTRVTHLPDTPVGNGKDDIEGVVEIPTSFSVKLEPDGSYWVTHADLSGLVKDSTFQSLNVSILNLKAHFFSQSLANWDTTKRDVSRLPHGSGTKTFTNVFQTCPENDPSYGNCKSNKGTVTRTKDITVKLPAPVIVSPKNGDIKNTNPTPFTGTGVAGDKVHIYEGSNVVADSDPADSSGNWTAMVPLADGVHTLFAKIFDAGGESVASNSVTITIDTVAPDKPTITLPAEGATVGGTDVSMAGAAEANSKVRIFDGGTQVKQVTATAAGAWNAVVTLTKGPHTTTVDATDAAGNTSVLSDPRSFNVTTAAPIILTPAQNAQTNNADVNISGTVEANSIVHIFEGTTLIGTTTASGTAWSLVHTFAEGSHTIFGIATAPDGFVSPPTPPRDFIVDLTPPDAPVITFPVDGSTVKTSTIVVTGTAEPLSTVSLYEGAQLLGKGTATGGSFAITVIFQEGQHTIHATATDLAGNVSPPSADVTFTVVDPLKILLPLQGSTVGGKVKIAGEADESASYVYIYEAGQLVTTTSVVKGKWEVVQPFESGIHTITVRSLLGGKLGAPSKPRTFTVDGKPPVITIHLPQGYTIFGITNMVFGTAKDDAAFDSKVDHVDLVWRDFFTGAVVSSHRAKCAACPGAKVNWTDDKLPSVGVYTLTATATDRVGNVSPAAKVTLILI